MEPVSKRPKKKAKKAAVEEQPAVPAAQNIPRGGYLWSRDKEELLVDYEPEGPAAFWPMEDDISGVGEDLSPPGDGQNNITSTSNHFSVNLAEDGHMAGAKRSQNCFGEGEPSRKASMSISVGSPLQEGDNATANDDRMMIGWIWRPYQQGGGVAEPGTLPLPYQWGAASQDTRPPATLEAILLPYQWGGQQRLKTHIRQRR
jgi:hypothetical protein